MQHIQAKSQIACNSCHKLLGVVTHNLAVCGYIYCKDCEKPEKLHPQHHFLESWDKDIFAEPLSDFCLEGSDGGILRSHKAVLAGKSKVLKAMITAGMSESSCSKVKITDMTSHELRPFLNFLYTGMVSQRSLECYAVSLYKASHKYDIVPLMAICERFLERNVLRDLHGVFEIAAIYELQRLQEAVLPHIFSEGFVESNPPPLVVKIIQEASRFECFKEYRMKNFKKISYLMELSLYRIADHLNLQDTHSFQTKVVEGANETTFEKLESSYKEYEKYLSDNESLS